MTIIQAFSELLKQFGYTLLYAFGNVKQGNRRYIYDGKRDTITLKFKDKKDTPTK